MPQYERTPPLDPLGQFALRLLDKVPGYETAEQYLSGELDPSAMVNPLGPLVNPLIGIIRPGFKALKGPVQKNLLQKGVSALESAGAGKERIVEKTAALVRKLESVQDESEAAFGLRRIPENIAKVKEIAQRKKAIHNDVYNELNPERPIGTRVILKEEDFMSPEEIAVYGLKNLPPKEMEIERVTFDMTRSMDALKRGLSSGRTFGATIHLRGIKDPSKTWIVTVEKLNSLDLAPSAPPVKPIDTAAIKQKLQDSSDNVMDEMLDTMLGVEGLHKFYGQEEQPVVAEEAPIQ